MRIHSILTVLPTVLSDLVSDFPDPFEKWDEMEKEFHWDDYHEKDMFDDWDYEFDDSVDSVDEVLPDLTSGEDKDIDISGPCESDLAQHPECSISKHDKGVCLWMSTVDRVYISRNPSISPECKQYLIEFFTDASAHPFEYFRDLRRECETDLNTHCDANSTVGQVSSLTCLRAHFDELSSRPCQDEITHLNSWASLNATWWSPTLWADCVEERKTVCANHTSAGLEEFRNCLDENRFSGLSAPCHKSLFESDLQAAPDPYAARRDLAVKCREESSVFCSDVAYIASHEEHLFCLFRASKQDSSNFSPDCAEAVASVVRTIESDYRLNVPIRKFCKSTIEQFCKSEKSENDNASFESDQVMTCLKRVYLFAEHRKDEEEISGLWSRSSSSVFHRFMDETEACMHAVKQAVLLSSLDWETDAGIHAHCLEDYQRLSHGGSCVAPADTCLEENFESIKSAACRKSVMLHSQLSQLDSDFRPLLLKTCAIVLDHLDCEENAPVDCLYDHIGQIHDPNCRAAITQDYHNNDRDYRLSYSLSLVCHEDREKLCGSTNNVLACMIRRIDEILDDECHRDVARLSLVGVSGEMDAVDQSAACANDVSQFCKNEQSIHSCLIQHIRELSEKCGEDLLELHSSSASVDAMDQLLRTACTDALVSDHCRHLSKSASLTEKVDCIQSIQYAGKYRDDEDSITLVSGACSDQLRAVQSLLVSDHRTNPELARDCIGDLKSFCGRTDEKSALENSDILCLVGHRHALRNSRCKQQIVSMVYRIGDDKGGLPGAKSACTSDISKFCAEISPGGGQLHACLRDHQSELSTGCIAQEFVLDQLEELGESTRNACKFELGEGVCKHAQNFGGPLHCLWRNIDEVTRSCFAEVRREMKGRFGNIWIDPELYSKCHSSVNKFISEKKCPEYLAILPPVGSDGLIPLPTNYTQAIGGEHVVCLGTNRGSIRDYRCLSEVEKILQAESQDPLMFRFGLKSMCKWDLSTSGVCGSADPFDTTAQFHCLEDKFDSVSRTCADSVKRIWRLSLADVKYNPEVSNLCETDIKEFCADNNVGRKTFTCLSAANGLSEGCANAVMRLKEMSVKADIKLSEGTPETQVARILKDDPVVAAQPANASTSLLLTGPLAVVSLASLFAVVAVALYKLVRWKFFPKGYVVLVQKD
jgi:hypothetical protein